MANTIGPKALRQGIVGNVASKSYSLAVETKVLFTVTGIVLVTGIVGQVTTSITVANTVKLQANPTVGTTSDLCAATDIGTTDTLAGNLLSISGAPTGAIVSGIGAAAVYPVTKVSTDYLGGAMGVYIAAGNIEQVTATGADGAITWYVTWVPIAPSSSLVAA